MNGIKKGSDMDYLKEAENALEFMCRLQGFPVIKNLQDISQGEMAVLTYLTFIHDGATAGELAKTFEIRTSRIAAILNALTNKKLARREKALDDGRKVLVFVSETGRNAAVEKKNKAVRHLARALEVLGDEDAKEFLRMMKKVTSKKYSEMFPEE